MGIWIYPTAFCKFHSREVLDHSNYSSYSIFVIFYIWNNLIIFFLFDIWEVSNFVSDIILVSLLLNQNIFHTFY